MKENTKGFDRYIQDFGKTTCQTFYHSDDGSSAFVYRPELALMTAPFRLSSFDWVAKGIDKKGYIYSITWHAAPAVLSNEKVNVYEAADKVYCIKKFPLAVATYIPNA